MRVPSASGSTSGKRLGKREQFQGARYEIAVAAIFVRAGYKIEWLTDASRRLPEFIARRDGSDVEIAVEAKSRPRRVSSAVQASARTRSRSRPI